MKKVIITALSFLCVIVCSCKKEPQDLLLGEWKVLETIEEDVNINGVLNHHTVKQNWYYTFGENGRGRIVSVDDSSRRYDITYVYDKGFNSILYTFGNSNGEWEIIVLTKNRFVFRSESTQSAAGIITLKIVATSEGEKI